MSKTIEKKLERVQSSLHAIELGMYADLSLSQCSDYIAWVAKFKKVPKTVWLPLCEKATYLWEQGY